MSMQTNEHLIRILKEIGYQPDSAGKLKLFYINNTDGSWRWAWPVEQPDPLFLEFYNNGNFKGWVFSLIIEVVFALRLQKFLFKTFDQAFSKTHNDHPASETYEEFAIFSGTESPDRKAVCCFRNHDAEVIYLKIPLMGAASLNIEREHRFLKKMATKHFHTFCCPELLPHSDHQRPFQKSIKIFDAIRLSSIESIHIEYLDELIKDTGKTLPISQTEFWKESSRNISMLKGLKGTRIPYGIRNKLFNLYQHTDSSQTCLFTMAHGDFTPWNCWYASNNRLNLYDFEFAMETAPAFFDLFHFVIQQGVLVEKITAQQIHARIQKIHKEAFNEQFNEDDFNFFFQLYLLYQVPKFLITYHQQKNWHIQINWLIDVWNSLLSAQLKEMESGRQLLNSDFLDKLMQTQHVVLKSKTADPYYPKENADLDVLVSPKDATVLRKFFAEHPIIEKVTVRKKHFMTSYDCFLHDGSFLSVDVLTELVRKQIKLLDEKAILNNRMVKPNGIAISNLIDDFKYTSAFYILNHAEIPQEHLLRFKQLNEAQQLVLMKHLILESNIDLPSCEELLSIRPSRAELLQQLKSEPFNSLPQQLKRGAFYLIDVVRSFFQSRGIIITFSGVDGAGKSTIIENLKYSLEKSTRRRVVVLRHRPSILPILSAWKYGKAAAEQRSASTLPRQGNNKSKISSLLRFGYYYTDYFLGRWKIWFKYILRGNIVVYDRYYFDFINDSRRSNIQLSENFIKKLYRYIQKPHLNFYLYAPASEIIKRKQELSMDTIEQLDFRYKSLFKSLGQTYKNDVYLPIENLSMKDTLNKINFYIQKELA